MEDQEIVELYFHRDEQAIVQTDRKYGPYCYSVAYNVLSDQEDARECVSDTYLAAWNRIPPARPSLLGAFLGKSPGTCPLTVGAGVPPTSVLGAR